MRKVPVPGTDAFVAYLGGKREAERKENPARFIAQMAAQAAERRAKRDRQTMPAVARIVSCVSDFYRIPPHHILSNERTANLAWPRFIVSYLARRTALLSFPEIGRRVGKHHTSIMNGVVRVESRMSVDPCFAREVRALEAAVVSYLSTIPTFNMRRKVLVSAALPLEDSNKGADDEAGVAEQPNEVSL